uniref:Uncharacterized protein n=1 Tax=Anguilla anguilla TaxID=7936 RepID=A0A0E9QHM9_ANGAN
MNPQRPGLLSACIHSYAEAQKCPCTFFFYTFTPGTLNKHTV